jgi:hypothetical protein
VITFNLFDKFAKENRSFKNSTEARTVFDNHLFHFMEYEKLPLAKEEQLIEILLLDPSYVMEIPIIYAPDSADTDLINKRISDCLKKDLVIMRGFLPIFGLNDKFFNKEYLRKFHCKKLIDVIIQEPTFEGFTKNMYILYKKVI